MAVQLNTYILPIAIHCTIYTSSNQLYHNIHLNYIGRNAKSKNCYLFNGKMLSPLKKKVLKWKSTCTVKLVKNLLIPKQCVEVLQQYNATLYLGIRLYSNTTNVLALWWPVTFYRNTLNASSPCICTLILFVTVYVKLGIKRKCLILFNPFVPDPALKRVKTDWLLRIF